ncbi:dna polymerase delta subunit 4 [Trichoderma arundinaceum]|uniref:Dna polymerase delta subunit 4 n=1 Tax=Trichoderma arundinaceum TaxID=490622 RepID=A0A395NZ33_TRIAR|nr:dna polymerase delta subunit 4 [Trichoderma arundinaceum]
MPTTRRSAASARGRPGPAKGQSTISFSGKVTKAVPKDLKKAAVDTPAVARTTIPERPASKDEVTKEEAAVDVAAEEPESLEEPELEAEEEVEPAVEQAPEKSEAELKAEKITDAQIKSYWKAIEKQRKAPRVHQEDLDLGEKVLRYFDVSSQYGIVINIIASKPCIGMTRLKRWQRAERLGLSPPIEVLAVLVKDDNKGNPEVETAHMDRIMNATALFT